MAWCSQAQCLTSTSVDRQDLQSHMVSLGHIELNHSHDIEKKTKKQSVLSQAFVQFSQPLQCIHNLYERHTHSE